MKYLTKNKYWELDKDYNIDKLLYLLIDRPDCINHLISGIKTHWKSNKKQFHRDYDLPAIVTKNGDISWCSENFCHRENNKPNKIFNLKSTPIKENLQFKTDF